ncbi:hypothetical protein LN893_03915 [Pontibacter sp. XAAS-A31]|nr:hypothetical protein [Pontibacter harenae]
MCIQNPRRIRSYFHLAGGTADGAAFVGLCEPVKSQTPHHNKVTNLEIRASVEGKLQLQVVSF